jgi:hypothetical protein
LEVLQRRRARFFNTCMMTTVTGAAVSDGLEDHQVVSGVGGQYNFVAMAHAMEDGRSVLMMKSVRDSAEGATSNLVWEYPHTTIPRHLRDLVVTEYGVAELRGRTDEECIQALIQVADARFQEELVQRAREAGKLSRDWSVPDRARRNTPEALSDALARSGAGNRFPLFPFGSDFDEVEEKLVPALGRLRDMARSRVGLLRAAFRGGVPATSPRPWPGWAWMSPGACANGWRPGPSRRPWPRPARDRGLVARTRVASRGLAGMTMATGRGYEPARMRMEISLPGRRVLQSLRDGDQARARGRCGSIMVLVALAGLVPALQACDRAEAPPPGVEAEVEALEAVTFAQAREAGEATLRVIYVPSSGFAGRDQDGRLTGVTVELLRRFGPGSRSTTGST